MERTQSCQNPDLAARAGLYPHKVALLRKVVTKPKTRVQHVASHLINHI